MSPRKSKLLMAIEPLMVKAEEIKPRKRKGLYAKIGGTFIPDKELLLKIVQERNRRKAEGLPKLTVKELKQLAESHTKLLK